MSNQDQIPEVTEKMKLLVQQVRGHEFPSIEETFFSIEGRIGRYENPTSDLLRFLMSPNEKHRLGPLFLQAFLVCLGKGGSDVSSFESVRVWREVRTSDNYRIDLLVEGRDYVLLIENKIGHWLANPLASYEEHAEKHYLRKEHYLAILSPGGERVAEWPRWAAVSYRDYCNALKAELSKTVIDRPISKWLVFAREFIIHLENTLYNPAMKLTPEETTFVEANLREIGDLNKLSDCYTTELLSELANWLQEEVPNRPFQFVDKGWGLNCETAIGQLRLQFRFWTPAHEGGNPQRNFQIAAWIKGLTEAQMRQGVNLFSGNTTPQDGGDWVRKQSFDSRLDAVEAMGKLAKELFDLWGNEGPASAAINSSV